MASAPSPPWRALFGGLRARLILLVLLAVVPALRLVVYTAAEQRQLAALPDPRPPPARPS